MTRVTGVCQIRAVERVSDSSTAECPQGTQDSFLCAIRHRLIGMAHCYIKSRMAMLQYSERCI